MIFASAPTANAITKAITGEGAGGGEQECHKSVHGDIKVYIELWLFAGYCALHMYTHTHTHAHTHTHTHTR